MENVKVTVINTDSNKGTSANSNASGDYVVDMANAGGVVVDDIISIKGRIGNKVRIVTVTITQAMIDAGMTKQNVTLFGIREHTFKTLQTLYNSNLPPNFTGTGSEGTVSWSVSSAFPEENPAFPVIVIDPAKITGLKIDFARGQDDSEVQVETIFYTKAKHGKKRIDSGRDFMEDILTSNEVTLEYAGLFFSKNEWLDDSTVAEVLFERQKYNMANQILKFDWRP